MDECKPYIDTVIVYNIRHQEHTHTYTHTNTIAMQTNIPVVIHWNFIAICSLSFACIDTRARSHTQRHSHSHTHTIHMYTPFLAIIRFLCSATRAIRWHRTHSRSSPSHFGVYNFECIVWFCVLMVNANAHDEYNVCIYGSGARFVGVAVAVDFVIATIITQMMNWDFVLTVARFVFHSPRFIIVCVVWWLCCARLNAFSDLV